jgi:hypothetical protein
MSLQWIAEAEEADADIDATRRTHTRNFKARTDPGDSWKVILRARPDLAQYQPHPDDSLAFVSRVTPTHHARGYWTLKVEYSTEVENEEENPLDKPATITVDTQPREKIALFDAAGRPVCNAAGDLFDDPPATRTVHNLLFTVEKNIPAQFPPWIKAYGGAVNTDAVRLRGITCGPDTLKVQKLTIGDIQTANDKEYSVLHLELEHDEEKWIHWQPNRGFHELYYDKNALRLNNLKNRNIRKSARKREILIDGAPAKEPQWLDVFGRHVKDPWMYADGSPNSKPIPLQGWEEIPPEGLVFLPFKLDPRLPFSRLPLR